ncbi:MAG: type 4a pilus biogenesis protein PilO [Gemmatimonadota bacterium]|nr:type 4a pilus biogenesis protein PilO [Gemmatimonadota bacterium]
MALLPQEPRDQYRMLGVILLIAVGAAFYLYLWSPRQTELAELEQRVEQIEQANALAEARMQNLDAVREELELGERQFAMLERLVPAESEVPAIYEAIASETQSLGLELVNVTPSDAVPDSAGYFMRQNWGMQIEGEYHDVGQFMARVASFTRIVRPDVEEIRPARTTNSGRQFVNARFRLETFVLPPEGGIPVTEGG